MDIYNTEIFKDIKGYEGLYQISNFGNVKSLSRTTLKCNKFMTSKDIILKPYINSTGYYVVGLHKNKKQKTLKTHQLVAITFLNHSPCGYKYVINHKDLNKLNNHIDNLEIVTQRENANHKHLNSSSKYTGVSLDKNTNKWVSNIWINGKLKYLGRFTNEIDASNAYQNKLKEINNYGN